VLQQEQACFSIDAPFFPPLASYESWIADAGNWVRASIIESVTLWSNFASYWGEPTQVSSPVIIYFFNTTRCSNIK
jgi:hypothetical protein